MSKYLINLTRKGANDDNLIFYPKSVAQQIEIAEGVTVKDHIESDIHLSGEEIDIFKNADAANGLAVLDERGYVKLFNLYPSILSIYVEYTDIDDMLLNGDDVPAGTMVMVLDASADDNVGSGWAVYRRLKDEHYDDLKLGWQRLAEFESIDLSLDMSNIEGKPKLLDNVDQMVEDAHTHDNFDTVNEIDVAYNNLTYKDKPIAFKEELVVIHDGNKEILANMNVGDFWIQHIIKNKIVSSGTEMKIADTPDGINTAIKNDEGTIPGFDITSITAVDSTPSENVRAFIKVNKSEEE